MPALHAGTEHEARPSDRLPDRAFVDQLAAGLQAGPEKSVRRASDEQAAFAGEPDHLPGRAALLRDRLLVVEMLPVFESLQTDFCMGRRDRQVDHQLDVPVRQQLLDPQRAGNPVFLRQRMGSRKIQIRAGQDLDVPELFPRLGVDLADVPASDNSRLYFFHGPHKWPGLPPNSKPESRFCAKIRTPEIDSREKIEAGLDSPAIS